MFVLLHKKVQEATHKTWLSLLANSGAESRNEDMTWGH
jgi:hypothetical protein